MFVESQILTDVIFNHIIERPLLKPTPVKKKVHFPPQESRRKMLQAMPVRAISIILTDDF